ncbi:unnamed protein product [Triticum turgidum subsp. durum]|uniref:Uncharacterized protein n=2 Tax=Triticum TaxID=4564 RepID=A0A9R0Q7J1_TRITD|nr:unnamed protein product [Triticum turgidum subsp. durum]
MISPIPPIRLRFARIRTTPNSRRSPLSIPCLASHNRAGNRAQRPCGSSPRRRYFIDEIRRRLCSGSSSPANPISSELPSPAAPPPANLAPPRIARSVTSRIIRIVSATIFIQRTRMSAPRAELCLTGGQAEERRTGVMTWLLSKVNIAFKASGGGISLTTALHFLHCLLLLSRAHRSDASLKKGYIDQVVS